MSARFALRLAAAAVLLVSGATGASALDFIVQTKTVEEDGFPKEQAFISNDATTSILLSLPTHWNRVDEHGSLTLNPPNAQNGLVRLEKSSLAPDTPFSDKGLDTYRRLAQVGVPPGATDVKCALERDNPLPIFSWKDHEFIFSYEFYGQAYKRAVIFVDLNAREQLMMTCAAPADQFEKVHEAGLDVLRSWQIVPVK